MRWDGHITTNTPFAIYVLLLLLLLLHVCSLEEGALLFFIKAEHHPLFLTFKELFRSIRSDKLDIGQALGPEMR